MAMKGGIQAKCPGGCEPVDVRRSCDARTHEAEVAVVVVVPDDQDDVRPIGERGRKGAHTGSRGEQRTDCERSGADDSFLHDRRA